MVPPRQPGPAPSEAGGVCRHPHCCAELLCLLRLSEIALAGPEPRAGLRAMVDELGRMPGVDRSVVALPDSDGVRLRYIAHAATPDRMARQQRQAGRTVAQAMSTRRMVQLADGGGRIGKGCVAVPILGGEQAIGVLGMHVQHGIPLDPWTEHVLWAAADLMALLLLDARAPAPDDLHDREALRLTRRQRDVLYELCERGESNEQIAVRLGLSARTVKVHLLAAYRQLDVRRRGDAIRLVLTRHPGWLAQERERRNSGSPA
jgi:DNA-binding CsgD family transcriptional regulator